MKTFLVMVLLLGFTALAFAAPPRSALETDGRSQSVQGFAPNGLNTVILGVGSVTYDMTTLFAWSQFSTADCKARLMPTSAKGIYPQFTLPGTSWNTYVVNNHTPFLNLSGCTSGVLLSQ